MIALALAALAIGGFAAPATATGDNGQNLGTVTLTPASNSWANDTNDSVFDFNFTCPTIGGTLSPATHMFITPAGQESPALAAAQPRTANPRPYTYEMSDTVVDVANSFDNTGIFPVDQGYGTWTDSSGATVSLTDIANAVATGSWSLVVACTYPISGQGVSYVPDSTGHIPATWTPLTLSADKSTWTTGLVSAATTTTLASSISGTDLTLTATVKDAGSTATGATGNMEFHSGSNTLGQSAVTAGVATWTVHNVVPGSTLSFFAKYDPDVSAAFLTSQSDPLTVNVPNAGDHVTALALAGTLSGTDAASLTATVQLDGSTAADATGTVEFDRDGTSVGTANITAGVATFIDSGPLTAGDHAYTAIYTPGTGSTLDAATSGSVTVTVPAAPTPLQDGDQVTPGDTYTVTMPAGTFTAGDTVSGEIHSDPITLTETATAAADGSVIYTFTAPSSVPAGTHTLILTGTPSGKSGSLSFTVADGSNSPAAFATEWVAATMKNPSGFATLIGVLVLLAAAAIAGWQLVWRRRAARTQG